MFEVQRKEAVDTASMVMVVVLPHFKVAHYTYTRYKQVPKGVINPRSTDTKATINIRVHKKIKWKLKSTATRCDVKKKNRKILKKKHKQRNEYLV